MTDEVIFTMIMSALLGFLLGGATSRQRFGVSKSVIYSVKSNKKWRI